MRIKDLNELRNDYSKVVGNWNDKSYDRGNLSYFFEPESDYATEVLANNHGAVCAGQYVEFVTSELFCPDGSWLGYEIKEDTPGKRRAAAGLLDYLSGKLAQTNFYNEITKLIKEGVLYNKGVIDTFYNKGLQFNTFMNDSVVCSKDTDESNARVYITNWISTLDLVNGFEGEAVEMYNQSRVMAESTKMIKFITAILPVNDNFFDMKKTKTKYKYAKVYLVCDNTSDFTVVKRKGKDLEGYTSFPLMKYMPHYKTSLAQMAMASAVRLNEYEQLLGEKARQVNRPAVGIPDTLLTHNNWDLGERGIVPLATNDRQPTPIESTQRTPLAANEIQRLEHKIDRIFKIDLISRIHITNVSQFEAARNYLNALKSIQPSASDLVTRVPITLLERINALLMDNDKEYRKLAKAAGGKLTMKGLTGKMEKFQKASALGYLAQGATPYVQIDPSASQRLNTDKAIEVLADSWDCVEVIATDEEVQAEREQMAQQQQAAQAQEAQMAEADVAAKQAQAQSAIAQE